jgi:protein phosphatase
MCQEKHMGSRAVIQICRDSHAARKRFGVLSGEQGIVYTRSGRRFFNQPELEQSLLAKLALSIENAGLWQALKTDWLTLDCEIMPWSIKAIDLIKHQYAAVTASSQYSLKALTDVLQNAQTRGVKLPDLLTETQQSLRNAQDFNDVYARYCWPVNGLADIKIAPFHILAGEDSVYVDRDHLWHMQMIEKMAGHSDGLLINTDYRVVNLDSEQQINDAVAWWSRLIQQGGEGMVVKPLDFLPHARNVQPALKVRGKDYLRIIYGHDYSKLQQLQRLKQRSLGIKRRLALREFGLGVEALQRFVERAALRQVHECVFAIAAMSVEPVDPRL